MDALTTCIVSALMDLTLPVISIALDDDAPLDLKEVCISEERTTFDLSDIPVASTFLTYEVFGKQVNKKLCLKLQKLIMNFLMKGD